MQLIELVQLAVLFLIIILVAVFILSYAGYKLRVRAKNKPAKIQSGSVKNEKLKFDIQTVNENKTEDEPTTDSGSGKRYFVVNNIEKEINSEIPKSVKGSKIRRKHDPKVITIPPKS